MKRKKEGPKKERKERTRQRGRGGGEGQEERERKENEERMTGGKKELRRWWGRFQIKEGKETWN